MVVELSSSGIDRSPSVSLDGLSIWFTTDRELFRGRILALLAPQYPVALGAAGAGVRAGEPAALRFGAVDRRRRDDDVLFIAAPRTAARPDRYLRLHARQRLATLGMPIHVSGLDTTAEEADPFRGARWFGRVLHADAVGPERGPLLVGPALDRRQLSPALAAHGRQQPLRSRTQPCRSIFCI